MSILIGGTVTRTTTGIELYGNGRIAHALLPRLREAGIPVQNVHDSKGPIHDHPARTVHDAERGRTGEHRHGPVAIDATAPHYTGAAADAWDTQLANLLAAGTSVVTCNKAPLARSWRMLAKAAARGHAVLLASATVGAGTPVLATLRRIHDAHRITSLEAVLSGTLSALVRDIAAGASLDAALAKAQSAGVAEPDPTLDLDGTDAFAKGIILHNAFFPERTPRTLADRQGTFRLDEDTIRSAAEAGEQAEAVTIVRPGEVRVTLRVRRAEDALAPPPGHAAVRARTRDGETYRLSGPGAGPTVTAGGIMADLLSLDERPTRGHIGIGP